LANFQEQDMTLNGYTVLVYDPALPRRIIPASGSSVLSQ
jgi:hypothetical protein